MTTDTTRSFSWLAALQAQPKQSNNFAWSEECGKAFAGEKKALCNASALALPDLNKPFEVCAACGLSLGAVPLQDGRPIALVGKSMSPAEQNYGVGEHELLDVIHALELWSVALMGWRSQHLAHKTKGNMACIAANVCLLDFAVVVITVSCLEQPEHHSCSTSHDTDQASLSGVQRQTTDLVRALEDLTQHSVVSISSCSISIGKVRISGCIESSISRCRK